jgi:putative transposase
MSNGPRIIVDKEIPQSEIDKRIKTLETDTKVLNRLYFIRFLYRNYSIKKAASEVQVSEPTAYQWLKRWNESGFKGIIPRFSGGAPSKLSEDQKQELYRHLDSGALFTLKMVKQYIFDKFGIRYSKMQVFRILTHHKMHHAKPYVQDIRRPDDAEDILKKNR